jgi:hypothetical protein
MPMHRAVDQRREEDERSDEVDNFHVSLKLAAQNAVPTEPTLTEALSSEGENHAEKQGRPWNCPG